MIFEPRIFLWSLAFAGTLYFGAVQEVLGTLSGYTSVTLGLLFLSAICGHMVLRRAIRIFVPILLSFVTPLLLSLIDHPVNIALFSFLSGLLYYFALLSLYRLRGAPEDQTAQSLLHGALMAAIFFFYVSMVGLYINFDLALAFMMLGVMAVTSLVTFVSFLATSRADKKTNVSYSALVGFFMGELFFVASFWPFSYLTTGSVLTSMYYLFWIISLDAFRNTLSLRKAMERILFVGALVFLVLVTSPWKVLV
jgi:hypothetical protein